MSDQQKWRGKSVLIVDDSVLVQEELSDLYKTIGMRVVGVANDGVEGLHLFDKLRPDLVSIDVIMPRMQGIEMLRKIRAIDSEFRFLLVTCLASDPRIYSAYETEMYAYQIIRKMPTTDVLRQALSEVFNQRHALPPLFEEALEESA